MKYDINRSHKLYQNILYDHIEYAIEQGVRRFLLVEPRWRLRVQWVRNRNDSKLQYGIHIGLPVGFAFCAALSSEIEWVERNPFAK